MSSYPMAETAKAGALDVGPRRLMLRDRLEENKRQLQERLNEVNEALAMLDKHPDFEKFHNVIGNVGY